MLRQKRDVSISVLMQDGMQTETGGTAWENGKKAVSVSQMVSGK